MTNKYKREDYSIKNPSLDIQTYHVRLKEKSSGKISDNYLVHDYSMDNCIIDIIEKLDDRYTLYSVYQPDTKTLETIK